MPAKLKVLKNGLVVDEFEITKQSTLIGRGEHCDLKLDFPGIGREMARLTAEKDGFYLHDASVIGIFIDGQRITTQKLKPGQEITCGSVQLALVDEASRKGPETGEISSATMLWEAAGFVDGPAAEKPTAFLVPKDQPGDVREIKVDEIVLGRSEKECQIPLPDKSVSKRHARIARAGQKFLIADMNSTNGTLLNGQRLTAAVELKEGDEVTIGRFVFVFRRSLDARPPKPPVPTGVLDMAKIERQMSDLPPPPPSPAEVAAAAAAPSKKRVRLLAIGMGAAILFLVLIIALKSGRKPPMDMSRLAAVETALRDGKLAEARKDLDALTKQFPNDKRLKLLATRLAEAEDAAASGLVSAMIEKARTLEESSDICGAVDLWSQVLQKTPENAAVQKSLGAAAYRIALVYEGKLPEADVPSAVRYLEMIQKYVKKENSPDYDTAAALLGKLREK